MVGRAASVAVAVFSFGCVASPERAPSEETEGGAGLRFVDVTEQAGLGDFRHVNGAYGARLFPETMSGAAAFTDYDGDGWQDLLLVGGGVWRGEKEVPALWLFRNRGDGTFEDRTQESGLHDVRAYGNGLAIGDYDNDGDEDVYLSAVYRNQLFRNDDGRYVEVGEEAGVRGDSSWSTSTIFLDGDHDGDLDLLIALQAAQGRLKSNFSVRLWRLRHR